MSTVSWLSGDQFRWEVLTLLVQVTLLLGATISVAWTCRRHPAARHAVCLCGLCAVLAAPMAGAALREAGSAWLTLNWPASGIEPAAAPLSAAESANFVHERDASPEGASLSGAMREREISSVTARSPEKLADHGVSRPADDQADLDLSAVGASLSTNSDPGRGVAQSANGAAGVAPRAWALATWSGGAAWLAGIFCLVWRRLRTAAQLRRIVRDALPVDSRIVEESLSQWPSLRRRPAVLSSRTLPVPIVCGLLRPRIIVPESLLRPECAPMLRDVLLHELSHILRRDPLAAVIQWLATVLNWPHPLIHVLSRQLSAAREDLCDNFVLQHRSPAEYARTLLQLAEGLSERRLPSAALAMLPRWSHLEERVAGLLDPRRATGIRNPRRVNGLILAATVCVGAAVAGIQAEDEPPAQSAVTAVEAQNSADDAALESSRRMIVGTVVDESGRAVAGASVRYASGRLSAMTARTNVQGRFELLIPEGGHRFHWFLLASDATGEKLGYVEIPDEDLDLQLKTEITLSAASRCAVAVRDGAGEPVSGAIVTAISDEHIVFVGEAVTDQHGVALLRYPPQAGVRWVVARKDGAGFDYFENYTSSLQRYCGPLPAEVELTLSGARSVAFRVTDSAGVPIPNASAFLHSFKTPGKIQDVNTTGAIAIPVDDAGQAHVSWLPRDFDGVIAIGAIHHDYEDGDQALVRIDQGAGELRVRLRRRATITGHVRDLDGRPAPGILVTANGKGEFYRGGRPRWGKSDRNGEFRLLVEPDVAFLVSVVDRDFSAAARSTDFIDEGARLANVDLTLIRGTLVRGRITAGADHAPVDRARVNLTLQGELLPTVIGRARIERSLRFGAWSDDQGHYSIRVPPGRYIALVFAGEYGPPREIEIPEDNPPEVLVVDQHFDLKANPLAGRIVRETDGTPLVGAKVFVAEVGRNTVQYRITCVSDPEGRFSLDRSGPRQLVYAVSSDEILAGFALVEPDVSEIRLALSPAATIVGQVVDPEGLPVDGFDVAAQVQAPGVDGARVWITTRTAGDGRYRLPGVAVDSLFTLVLNRSSPGAGRASIVREARIHDLGTQTMRRGPTPSQIKYELDAHERLLTAIDMATAPDERRILLRRAQFWAEELLVGLSINEGTPREGVLLLNRLDARPADPDNNAPGVPYTAAYKPLLRVLSDPKFTEDARAAAKEGLTRILNGADDRVEGGGLTAEARRQIEEALAAAK